MSERLEATAQLVQERVIILEQQLARWTCLETEVAGVKAWSAEAPVAVQTLHSMQATPQARLSKAQQLQTQIDDRERLIARLSAETEELIIG